MFSIIIPIYNEEKILRRNSRYFKELSQKAELIFVDGGSKDQSIKAAQKAGCVLHSKKNRAAQMNKGAQKANNELLIFLHADTVLNYEDLDELEAQIKNKNLVGGCFCQVLDQPGLIYKWIAWTGNVRAKLFKIFYGDQGIFVQKDTFNTLGGFPETKICEDILFTRSLKKTGKVGLLRVPVFCSTRRWRKQGLTKTFLINMRVNFALTFGQDINRLANDYNDVR